MRKRRRGKERRGGTTHQGGLGVLAGTGASLVGGLGRETGQVLLDAALVLGAAADVAVVGMFRDDAFLPCPLHGYRSTRWGGGLGGREGWGARRMKVSNQARETEDTGYRVALLHHS